MIENKLNKKIYIIGGGVSGMTSACFLKKQGYQVCIIEKNDTLGGRLFEFREKGFRFNNGPSWYWMKDVFEEVFDEIGIPKNKRYKLERLDPQYKVVFENSELNIPGKFEDVQKMFNNKSPDNKLDLLVEQSKKKYEISRNIFLNYTNLSFTEYLNFKTVKNILGFNFNISYRDYCKRFTKNNDLFKILEWPSLFIGSSPEKISAMYSMLTYSMIYEGTYLPENGLVDISRVLAEHCKTLGVEIKLNEGVEEYSIKKNKIDCIRTSKKFYNDVDMVISGCDYQFNESILPKKYRSYPDSYWNKLELCPSCLLFHLGINKQLPTQDFHVLFFDQKLEGHMDKIYNMKTVPDEPLFYLNITSKKIDSAPKGCENLFILIPTGPHMILKDSDIDRLYNYVIKKIEKYYQTEIRDNVIVKKVFADKDFKSRFNAYGGNAYGLSCHPLQSAFLKPRIKSRYVNNLYYCGQLTNPGPGVPPCLLSGIVTSKYAIKNRGRSSRFHFGEVITLVMAIFVRTLSVKALIKILLKEIFYVLTGYIL